MSLSLLQLPVKSDIGHYELKTELDKVKYTFSFRFNTRADRWIMDIKTDGGEILVAGIPLLAGVDFLSGFRADTRLPQGVLFLLNTVDENASPGRDDLGNNALLIYQGI
ncbi:MAG: hypothetical protein AB1847_17575 [bacterium]